MGTGTELAHRFFASNGGTYDQIALLSTLGLDILWKKKILDKIPLGASYVIDQACGTGILTFKIAKRFPHCRIIGVDLHEDFIAVARQKAQALQKPNVTFVQGRAEDVILDGNADCITSSYLAKYVELDRLVANAHAMLRPGGVLVMHELTHPENPLYAALWRLQFLFLQTYGAWRYPEWAVSLRELPPLLTQTNWLPELTANLRRCHFSDITTQSLFLEASSIVSAVK